MCVSVCVSWAGTQGSALSQEYELYTSSTWLFSQCSTLQSTQKCEREENCQQCRLNFSFSWESGTCAISQLVNKKWPSVTLSWHSLGSSLLQHLLSKIKRSTKVTTPVYKTPLWVRGQALTGVAVPKWLWFTASNCNATRKHSEDSGYSFRTFAIKVCFWSNYVKIFK